MISDADKNYVAPLAYEASGFTIRAYRPGDGAALADAITSSYEHLIVWMPWARRDQSIEESESLCRRFAAKYLLNEDFTLGIWRGETLLGGTGFHLRHGPLAWKVAEIGMWIRASEAGKGLGTDALRAMLDWGFTDWGWERIVWKCDTLNPASARVAEKCGLTLEGTMRSAMPREGKGRRSMHLYAMVVEDWFSKVGT